MTAQFGAMISNKPREVTVNIGEDGNCTKLLGEECLQSLKQAASEGGTISFGGYDGCANTLDTHGDGNLDGNVAFGRLLPIHMM